MPYKFLLPRHKKRSRALSLKVLIACNLFFLSLIGLKVFSTEYKDFNILGFATDIQIDSLLNETNKERVNYGLKPLKISPKLSQAAHNKAQDMFSDNYWDHISPDGTTPWDFILSSGYSYSYAGENLAKDFMKSSSVVKAWMNSPSHRDNLLNPNYSEIGFAVVNGKLQGEDTTLVVQMFGTPISGAAEGSDSEILSEVTEQVPESTEANVATAEDSAEVFPLETTVANNLITINKDYVNYLAYAVLIFFAGALVIDGFIAFKMHHMRLTGNTLSHFILFIVALAFLFYINKPGIV